jgi:hypothetical protein
VPVQAGNIQSSPQMVSNAQTTVKVTTIQKGMNLLMAKKSPIDMVGEPLNTQESCF